MKRAVDLIDGKLDVQSFVKRCIQKYGIFYSYDFVKYNTLEDKVKIICPIHGQFIQRADYHLTYPAACIGCREDKLAKRRKEKCLSVHGNKYNYSKTDFYSGVKKSLIIICDIHGEFYQTLDKHYRGRGCWSCGGSRRKTQEEFLSEAKEIHGEKWNYSKSIYDNYEDKIIIICDKHGEFLQTPHNHIKGKQGCPTCVHRISIGETEWLNSLGIPNDEFHRNVLIPLNGRKIKADGYVASTNTIYEYYGDYYHGNPKIYKGDKIYDINPHTKLTYMELYRRTISKEIAIQKAGFNLVCIWEYDWKNRCKTKL